MRWLQREEQRVEGRLQWIQEDAEDQTAADEHDEDHPEHADAVVDLKRFVRQKVPQNMASIERRYGDEVEHKEQKVQQNDVVEKQSDGKELGQVLCRDSRHSVGKRHGCHNGDVAARDGVLEDDEQNQRHGSRDQVARRPRQGDENVVALVILEVAGGHRGGLRPTKEHSAVEETDKRKDDRAEWIEVLDGIQRQAAEHLRGGIAEPPSSPGMGTLMHTEGEYENHNLEDNEYDLLIHGISSLPDERSGLSRVLLPLHMSWNPYRNASWRDRFGRKAHSTEHRVLANIGARKNRGVVGDSRAWPQFGGLVRYVGLMVDVVGMAVNIRVVGDAGPIVEDDLAAVVEQDILVDGAVIPNGEVVAVGELNVVEDFDSLAHMPEDMAA
jgi:hypothetical protein